jgi:hypothetical protein
MPHNRAGRRRDKARRCRCDTDVSAGENLALNQGIRVRRLQDQQSPTPYGALHRAVVDPVQRFLEGITKVILPAVIIALILAASLAGARRWKKDRDDQHRRNE